MLALPGVVACGSASRGPTTAGEGNDSAATISAQDLAKLAELSPAKLPLPPADISNRWADDPDAAAFGQRLFFESRFSGQLLDSDNDGSSAALGRKGEVGKVACAGCHIPESEFSDSRTIRQQISLAAGWGRRRTPSLLDVGHSALLMWDGRRDALYNQILGVIESPVEMNSSRLFVAEQVFALLHDEYEAVFGPLPPLDDTARFPALDATQTGCAKLDGQNKCVSAMRGAPGDAAEFDGMKPEDQDAVTRVVVNLGKALGAYERLLSCGSGRFDRWMQGDSEALSQAERRGAALFVGKAKCVTCHSGPFLSDEQFHNVGLRADVVATVFLNAWDVGAAEGVPLARTDTLNVAGPFSDGDDGRLSKKLGSGLEGAFRTPRLRCVSGRPSFMHTGQMVLLDKVIAFFSQGGDAGGYPGKNELEALNLSGDESADLLAFLKTLDGPGPSAELLSAP